jgi:hypothetical protein
MYSFLNWIRTENSGVGTREKVMKLASEANESSQPERLLMAMPFGSLTNATLVL